MTLSSNTNITTSPVAEQGISQHYQPWLAADLTQAGCFATLEFELEATINTLWCYMAATDRPSFSNGLLRDLTHAQTAVRRGVSGPSVGRDAVVRTIVLGSHTPGVYNLGGDLSLFADCILRQDRTRLTQYARLCAAIVFNNSEGYGGGITTIALVQGQAMGGGFEAALSCHAVVAERSARLGLPEVLFNLFPGMGAFSFLSRRLSPAAAERMILSGKIYTAAELHELGIVDVLAEDGGGVAAVRRLVREMNKRPASRQAMRHVCNAVNPITQAELIRVTDIWVDAALRLTEDDLRRMRHLVDAQERRAPVQHMVAAE